MHHQTEGGAAMRVVGEQPGQALELLAGLQLTRARLRAMMAPGVVASSLQNALQASPAASTPDMEHGVQQGTITFWHCTTSCCHSNLLFS